MTLSNVFALCAVLISLMNMIFLATRSSKSDHKADSVERTTIIVKLENIDDRTKTICNTLTKLEESIEALKERVILLEVRTDTNQSRIEALEGKE